MTMSWWRWTQPETIINRNERSGGEERMPRVYLSRRSKIWTERVRIGSDYLVRVAPLYVFTGVGMALYFASQGAGRMTWPFAAGVARLSIVLVLGGYWIHAAHGSLAGLFWVVAVSQIAFGSINAFAMANRLTFKGSGTGHLREVESLS